MTGVEGRPQQSPEACSTAAGGRRARTISPLPQQIIPPDARQAALTLQHFGGETSGLEGWFLAERACIDATLGPTSPPARPGKPYPYGRCEEITAAMVDRLRRSLALPNHPLEQALHDFVAQGGIIRSIWGVLRQRYFQNALQIGTLYVDVSNDTVVLTKPKVEILPVAESGMENVRDLRHFAETAEAYWQSRLYANLAVPSLAPVLPIIAAAPGYAPVLQSACDYMIELQMRDSFRDAAQWLASAPPPPPEVLEGLRAITPADLHPGPGDLRRQSLDACARAGVLANRPWRDARVADYLRIGVPAC